MRPRKVRPEGPKEDALASMTERAIGSSTFEHGVSGSGTRATGRFR